MKLSYVLIMCLISLEKMMLIHNHSRYVTSGKHILETSLFVWWMFKIMGPHFSFAGKTD